MCGQLSDGRPCGFCRIIDEDGAFMEGFFNEDFERVGLVRYISYSGY